MRIKSRRLYGKEQTGAEMYRLVDQTAADINGLSKIPLCDYFDLIKNIPYRRDIKPREIIARPRHLLKFRNAGLDCKKKSILLASWAKQNKIPFRFVATSKRKDRRVHHVFPQILLSGQYINVDATYPHNRINENKPVTKIIILRRKTQYAL